MRSTNSTRYARLITLVTLLLAVLPIPAMAQRARPPEFTAEDRAAFFDNAFDALVGERPDPSTAPVAIAAAESAERSTDVPWAELVSADVLETEIKRQASALQTATRSATAFKAGGFREATDALGMLATAFAVTDRHTGAPRWRDTAAGLRDLLAASAERADAATDTAYAEAAARAGDLTDLIRGGRPATPDAPAKSVDWSELASRSTLMRRMEQSETDRLRGWVSDERTLRRNSEDARHEAQMLALLAEAILQPEAAEHDDPDYQAFARQLRDAAIDLAAAAEAENQPAAAAAMIEVSRSCVDCHADYRG